MSAATATQLEASDYEKIFEVLETCEEATDMGLFRRRLVTSVSRVFGIQGVTFFCGPSLAATFTDRRPVVSGDRDGRLLSEYLNVWGKHDVFAIRPAIRRLATSGSVSLDQLGHVPPSAAAYVDRFLRRPGLQSCNAFAFEMGCAGYGLVGAFDPDPHAVSPRDTAALRLLFRRLRIVARSLVGGANPLSDITKRQREVVELVARGFSNAQIAEELVLAHDTVKKYVSRALAATGCRTRTELTVRALSGGIGPA
jgi:DNA-binding CsgD family transcriptional regulator